ncbi:MAG TPA: phosphoribosylaminoimidazolesuccinocarboxamide synthase [Bacteroidales bacterium]|nr:MAG: Phosphoribosylaminoimidazole-succinocarboxamide synthase [Bacteroidetes bacterium ADurb.Bin139]HOG24702.1 phosphoribosylaminoimidazolesuccinocarboxamide synthase [Bacteroidales bacterium]HOR11072.1 phosphoribosylaminoimidazolesuccinocarboxamide synthase [Bacteroidales bacterium]HOZ19843.1 phosphoribosylaminoimidazolesuccinocarboxamide synthase [Bacteroidales bacterium]HPB77883.1 phosphoribosylaminoimidazolesuccinocarboxamide synthase [Bacteroidales bacterium]
MKSVTATQFHFPKQTGLYVGKVRDVYTIDGRILVMIATDRISAFDVVFPRGITYKGQILNTMASRFLDLTSDIVPNWKIASPHPMVTVGYRCEPFPVEMIVRGYLTGSSWRTYKSGSRSLCGIPLPEGMKEHQAFPEPIITPTTKAQIGSHDQDISREEIIRQGLVSQEDYLKMEAYSLALFSRGQKLAKDKGLILVDTKYEFGKLGNQICLIDEIHTPDSSRYFYAADYQQNYPMGLPPRQLSKEFVREWLMENGFSGQPGQKMPELTDTVVRNISDRYIELFECLTGTPFVPLVYEDTFYDNMEGCIRNMLARL